MSDEGPYVALEDQTVDAPTPEPEPEPPTPVPAEQPIAAAPEATPEPETDEDDLDLKAVPDRLTNERMVPLHEVAKLREKARTLRAERESISAKVADLETKAARAAELEAAVQQWQTYAQQMAAQPRQPAAPAVDPQVEQRQKQADAARRTRAERIAKRFDLYKPDGTLDVDRGLEHLSEQEELAREQAEQMVRPLRTETAQSKSHANRAALAAHLQKQGTPVDTTLFNQLWNHLTPELTANQEVAAVAAAAALGWPLLFGKQAPAQVQQALAAVTPEPAKPPPVVVTEPVTQGRQPGVRLTGIAARAAKELGLTHEQAEKQYGQRDQPWTVLADDTEGNR